MTHPPELVGDACDLLERGDSVTQVARQLGLARETVKDWAAGRTPGTHRRRHVPACPTCQGQRHDLASLHPRYPYLLGLYLGDGCLSAHARHVFRLRIVLDKRYPGIITECATAMRAVMPASKVGHVRRKGCVEVSSYSRAWPCLFPQHAPGRKHERSIRLTAWQLEHVRRSPQVLLRGLIHSDGCRFTNTGTNWVFPRYSFSNVSDDIRRIFCDTCDLLDLHYTHAPRTVYVSRKADVARMDEFIGPKS